jgi:hypothetical protein
MKKVPAIYVVNNQQLLNIEITPLIDGKYLANGSTLQSASLKKNLKSLYVKSSNLPNKFMMENFGVDFMGPAFIFKNDYSNISKDDVTAKGKEKFNLEKCYICKNYLIYDEKLDNFHKMLRKNTFRGNECIKNVKENVMQQYNVKCNKPKSTPHEHYICDSCNQKSFKKPYIEFFW